jgi:hypothetical protein
VLRRPTLLAVPDPVTVTHCRHTRAVTAVRLRKLAIPRVRDNRCRNTGPVIPGKLLCWSTRARLALTLGHYRTDWAPLNRRAGKTNAQAAIIKG